MSGFSEVTIAAALAMVALSSAQATSQPLERQPPPINQAYSEHKDQKEALDQREAELSEMARQALLKARQLTAQGNH